MVTFTQFLLRILAPAVINLQITASIPNTETNGACMQIGLNPMVTVVLLQLSIQLKERLDKVDLVTNTTVKANST